MGRCGDFFRNFNRFFGSKVHRQFNPAALNKQPHHACVGRTDLQICLNIAFVVDAHGLFGASRLLGLFAIRLCLEKQGRGRAGLGMTDITLERFGAADRDWLIDQHSAHYAAEEGFDDTFGPMVAGILDAFLAEHDPDVEQGWIAKQGATRLGCIFCVRVNAQTAKLRLFMVAPEARGQGLGRRLIETCMGFARARDYRDMKLWTHQSQTAAGALYAKTGWTLVESRPAHSFGKENIEETWTITL